MGQQAVVGCAVLVKEGDVWLYFTNREGLAAAIAHVDAVEASPHTHTVRLGSAAYDDRQYGI